MKTSRLEVRRAKSEAVLAEILPADIEPGMSYHVISHGDVDALSYLIHIARYRPLKTVTISTWCMAMPNVVWIADQLRSGRIGHAHFCLGEIFPDSTATNTKPSARLSVPACANSPSRATTRN